MTEKEENGKEIEYRYDSDTQQVSAKYIKDGKEIKLRQFFFYDSQTAALVKVIKDDGSNDNEKKLDNVTERLITDIKLADTYPVGQPKVIKEKFWDGTGEVLLRGCLKSIVAYSLRESSRD